MDGREKTKIDDSGWRNRNKQYSDSTRRCYEAKIRQLKRWMTQKKPQLMTADGEIRLESDGSEPILGPSDFQDFLTSQETSSLKTTRKVLVSHSCLSGHRSALKYYFKKCKVKFDDDVWKDELNSIYIGLKKATGEQRQVGHRKATGEKDNLPFILYEDMAKYFQERGDFFGCTYHTMSWNVMCRSSNTRDINLNHMRWFEDALGVYILKNDQAAEKQKDPKHCYANPQNPAICLILNLGLYLLTERNEDDGMQLFPGGGEGELSAPYTKFAQKVYAYFKTERGKRMLASLGLKREDIGIHSWRKGPPTFVLSRSTESALVPTSIRCGCALGGMQDRYVRYNGAGDQFVGRLAAGLDLGPHFAVLPPHFVFDDDSPIEESDLDAALEENFPSLSKLIHLRPILRYSLASVLYHHDYLRQTLPPTSMLFQQPIFRSEKLQAFRSCIRCGLSSPCVKATGIPPTVRIERNFFSLNESVLLLADRLNEMQDMLTGRMEQVLREHNALATGPASVQQVRDMLSPILARLDSFVSSPAMDLVVSSSTAVSSSASPVFSHVWSDGSRHALPEAFDWPTANARTAFSLWLLGNPSEGWPPLCQISASDLKLKKAKKRLSDWRRVNSALITFLKGCNSWIENPNQLQVDQMFEKAKSALPLFEESEPFGEEGRRRQLKVTNRKVQTLARLLVKRRRLEANETDVSCAITT